MNPLSNLKALSLLIFASLLFASCKKETETLQVETPTDYVALNPGKYITYRTDSTVFVNFGQSSAVHSYQEKYQVDSLLTDNLGRPSYRVFRFLRDTAGKTAWQPAGTIFVTPTLHTLEVIENNLRFLKLADPVKESTTWKGNQFLPYDPYSNQFDFSNDDGMSDWESAYTETGTRLTLGGTAYTNVATVLQVDESNNAPVTNTTLYGFRNYATEKYAKGLGLIYQEVVMWEYQPPTSPRPGYRGFSLKRSIIDHN